MRNVIPATVTAISLSEADRRLEPALEAMQRSTGRATTLILSPWADMPLVSLLPFHLHLRWAGRVPWLSLNARFAFLPAIAESLSATPLYPALDAQKWRQQSRSKRHSAGGQTNDFASADWERAVIKHREELVGVYLPGRSFVALDSVARDGAIRRGSRGALGRWTPSDLARPQVLVSSRGDVGEAEASVLADVDLLLIDLQGLHGPAARKGLNEVLHRRGNRPTVVFASCPSDLEGTELSSAHTESWVTETLPRAPSWLTQTVGRDRALLENTIDFALDRSDRPATPGFHALVKLARHAWWGLRQAIVPSTVACREYASFSNALDILCAREPDLRFQLADACRVLKEAAERTDLAQERQGALLSRILARNVGDTAVLTRDDTHAIFLRQLLAAELGVTEGDLPHLGVYVRPHYWRRNAYRCNTCILAGYFGPRSLDAALRCQPANVTLIADEVEQRAAWFALRRQREQLSHLPGLEGLAARLDELSTQVSENVANLRASVGLSLQTAPTTGYSFAEPTTGLALPNGTLQIIFTDGSSVIVPEGARFDVYGRLGNGLRAKRARDLATGDEIIVTNNAEQARFSDLVLDRLDAGPLKIHVEKRADWLHLVQSFSEASQQSPGGIVKKLAALGHVVDRASARSWISKTDETEPAVPSRYSTFAALAQVLGMPHSDAELRQLYLSVRRVRTVHRLAGRGLARAIRMAHLGALDAPSQHRLQQQWGIEPHELQDAARVATVDQILG